MRINLYKSETCKSILLWFLLVAFAPLSRCQVQLVERWILAREAELLPVPYFHVVFTLPQLVAPLALQNQQLVYGLLFHAAAETLLQIAADSRHLGARIGFWRCCIPGDKTFIIIHTSIASFPAAESPATSDAGFRVGGSSFFRSRCSAVSSGANSSHI